MSENSGFIIGGVAIAAIAFAGFMIFNKTKKLKKSHMMNHIDKDILTMKEVIEYFRDTHVLNQLQQNKNYIAVVMREQTQDGKIGIILTLFDAQNEKILDTFNAKYYCVKELDSDLKDSFGNKDMIVLE
ncbi:hypothetical protein CQA53_04480 [Helicobacter didelphidarum]|uniref:Uncharacterized protein n=1 Tax=Helicobacter didelphidarum TaxID=2040648 RepID=A0A3D8IMB3_9HELI|nr:hypothetical protein [Helicobacter didelphidarum]RDU66066.1 hypothetical protein CQA53_04480 [Helicobacter didelphidarum]